MNAVQTIGIKPRHHQVPFFEELPTSAFDWSFCPFRSKHFQDFAFCCHGPFVQIRFLVAARKIHRNGGRSKSTPNKAHHGRIMFTKSLFFDVMPCIISCQQAFSTSSPNFDLLLRNREVRGTLLRWSCKHQPS